MVSSRFQYVPILVTTPDRLSLSHFRLECHSTDFYSWRVASPDTAILSHQHPAPCEFGMPRLSHDSGIKALSHPAGKGFCFLYDPLSLESTDTKPRWKGILTDDVLSQMLRRLLAYRIHHTIISFRLRATQNLLSLPNLPVRFGYSWNPPSFAARTKFLDRSTRRSLCHPLPAGGYPLFPARITRWLSLTSL